MLIEGNGAGKRRLLLVHLLLTILIYGTSLHGVDGCIAHLGIRD